MPNLTILLDGTQVMSREVDNVECEETAGGTLDLHATFPPIDMSGLPATGTFIDAFAAAVLSPAAVATLTGVQVDV